MVVQLNQANCIARLHRGFRFKSHEFGQKHYCPKAKKPKKEQRPRNRAPEALEFRNGQGVQQSNEQESYFADKRPVACYSTTHAACYVTKQKTQAQRTKRCGTLTHKTNVAPGANLASDHRGTYKRLHNTQRHAYSLPIRARRSFNCFFWGGDTFQGTKKKQAQAPTLLSCADSCSAFYRQYY